MGGSPAVAKAIAERANPNAPKAPAAPAAIIVAPAQPARSASAAQAEPDLFSNDQPPAPAPAPATRIKQQIVRRGRKPAPLDAKPHTQQELDLFQLSLEIDDKNARESGDLGFLATAMIYASLPHSDIGTGIFKRKNGPTSLTIMNDPEIGLPFGKIPRIMTAFLCTEAKRHKDTRGRTIHLGHSQAEFMEKIGMTSRGGKRGDIARTHDQARRLFTSTIQLTGEPGTQFHWKKVDISPNGMLLWNPQRPDEKTKWQSSLILGEDFFNECVNHSVPLDLRVIHNLRSPLAIDIYIWLTYRYNSIVMPTPVTWKQLKWQFGSNYADTKKGESDFKVNFKAQLRNVLAIYREAKLKVEQDFLLLLPSKPHILPAPDA